MKPLVVSPASQLLGYEYCIMSCCNQNNANICLFRFKKGADKLRSVAKVAKDLDRPPSCPILGYKDST
ncbi:hypothetical protein XELAEV_18047076mg [Xenopus laevis]|uniref:Uncharacterized protein n=1 Tax=Xenopus laevis TaxID=8355 RepID=A0A974BU57_XENLA|nr:hypothetical protein XELAEV_18047076mg [Xenopus laevis]